MWYIISYENVSHLGNLNDQAHTYFGQLQFWYIHENGKDLWYEPFPRAMLSLLYHNLFKLLLTNSLRLKGLYCTWAALFAASHRWYLPSFCKCGGLPVWDDRDFPPGGLLWANLSVDLPQISTFTVWLGRVSQPDVCKPRELTLKSWRLKWDWN